MSFWHRLRHDWGRELTAFVCSLVLVALFLYLFNDFLNEKVVSVSETMRKSLALWAYWGLWFLCGLFLGLRLRLPGSCDALASFALSRGEKSLLVKRFRVLMVLLTSLFYISVTYVLCIKILGYSILAHPYPLLMAGGVFCVAFFWPRARGTKKEATFKPWQPRGAKAASAMFSFRRLQMLGRNRPARFVFASCYSLSTAHFFLAKWQAPFFLHGLLAIFLTLLVSIPLLLQLKEDLSFAWAERSMGVSHESVVKTYFRLALLSSLPLGLWGALCYAAGLYKGEAFFWQSHISLFCLTVMGPIMAPSILFQLEPRRPALSWLALFLICLFVGTGILAHIAAVVLIPILIHYAGSYQHGRYYRA